MKEIGGYFGLEELVNNEFYKNLISLNSGRNALLYLLKARRDIQKLYIPYYLCNSISDMLKKNGYEYEYYYINANFLPEFNKNILNHEYLYIVNYYGQITNDVVLELKQKFKRVILDNTQAFYQKPLSEIDTIYSCRKFFGVSDGAYLSSDIKLTEELETDISKDRMTYILGRFEGFAYDYYANFQEMNELFEYEPIKYMSKLTHNLLGAIDYEKVRNKRNENYKYLENKFKALNRLKLYAPDGAFAYPIYIENGIEIRKILAKKKIYIPILWPNVLETKSKESIEYKYAANILPLPCDQRYKEEDLHYLSEKIESYLY